MWTNCLGCWQPLTYEHALSRASCHRRNKSYETLGHSCFGHNKKSGKHCSIQLCGADGRPTNLVCQTKNTLQTEEMVRLLTVGFWKRFQFEKYILYLFTYPTHLCAPTLAAILFRTTKNDVTMPILPNKIRQTAHTHTHNKKKQDKAHEPECRHLCWVTQTTSATLSLDTFVRHSYLTLLLDTLVRHSYLTLLYEHFFWHSSGTLLLDTLVRHSDLTLLQDTLA